MKKALSKWATKQLGSLVKQRASSPLLSSLVSGKNLGTKAIAGAVLGTGAEAIFGGDGKNQDALLAKLKAEGVVGTGPNQVSEEEFRQHMERGSNTAFSPLESGLEMAGTGGILGGLITPFLGGDKKAGISNNTADMIRQYQAARAGRARIKEDTGFELEDEKTLDELYGKENAFGNAETVDFTSSPLGWIMGEKKAPTLGRGEFRTGTETRYGSDGKPYHQNVGYHKTQKDMDEYVNWSNNILKKAQESGDVKEITKALKQAPEGHRKSRRFFDTLHATFKKGYKGSDITSESGKKDFKSFVQGILPSAGGTFDPATGRGTPAVVDPSRRTPEELLSNYLSPEGYEWDSEDAYKQSGMAPNDMAGNPSAVPTASTTPTAVAPTTPADAVRAQAAQPQQLSVPQQQAADIRAQGGQTAQDNSRQERNFADTAYNNAYPKQPLGSQAARDAALARMRPNVLQGNGVREYTNKNGTVGAYSTLPDAFIPQTVGVEGKGAVTYRERAYGKHFATPEAGTNGTPYLSGGNWTGNNPVTGDFKDPEGNVWVGEKAFRNSQLGESGMIATDDPPEMDYGPYDEKLPSERKKYNNDRTFSFLRARVMANAEGDRSLDGMSSDQYHDPAFAHKMKGPQDNQGTPMGYGSADPSAGYRPAGTDIRYDQSRRELPPMPSSTIDEAIGARNSLRNAMKPKLPDFNPVNAIRNLGMPPQRPMETNRQMKIRKPLR